MSAPLFTETRGSGPDLFLVHGWAMHGGVWEETVDLLAEHYRCTVIDLPGHGRSREPSNWRGLDELLDRVLDVAPRTACWIGWSLGGLIALAAAVRRPERINRVVLVGSSPCFSQRDDWHCAMSTELLAQFAAALDADYRGTLRRFLALEVHGSDHAAEQLRKLRRMVFEHGDPDPAALHSGLGLLRTTDLRAELGGLHCPLRVLIGRRDALVPSGAAAATARLVHDGRARVLGNVGHAPFLNDPATFAQALQVFVDD